MKLPKRLKPIFWSANFDSLDFEKDAYYIIHQILVYGDIEEIKWLFKNYSKRKIIEIFKKSFKDYRPARFYFVKNILLGLESFPLEEKNYVKNTPRLIR